MNRDSKNILLIVLLCAASSQAFAEEPSDTAKVYQLGEVVVTATRTSLLSLYSPVSVNVINRPELLSQNGTTLASAIDGSPGIFVKDYGGLGALKTLSLRGTGAEHTLILIDGIRYNSVQNGLVDLGLLSTEFVERVEVVRGGNSALYGTDALGGVVNLLTLNPSQLSGVELSASLGSFLYRRYGLNVHAVLFPPMRLMIGGWEERSSGDFPFIDVRTTPQRKQRRSNADVQANQVFGKLVWQAEDNFTARLFLTRYASQRGVPGPLIGTSQGTARQNDKVVDVITGIQHRLSKTSEYKISAGFQSAYQRYFEPSALQIDNFYSTRTLYTATEFHHAWGEDVRLVSGVDAGYAVAGGNAFSSSPIRRHIGTFAAGEIAPRPDGSTMDRIRFFPSIRYDYYDKHLQAWSPKMGIQVATVPLSYGLVDEAVFGLHSSLGRNFRTPTFNELYYNGAGGTGNPSLLPEHSVSFDVGLVVNFHAGGRHFFDLTYFNIQTENRILWLPTSSAFIWSPNNVGRVHSTGMELDYRWNPLPNILSIHANYTLTNAVKKFQSSPNDPGYNKQLIYVPLDMGNLSTTLKVPLETTGVRFFTLHLVLRYVGVRYTTEDNTEWLDRYTVLDGNIGLEIELFGVSARWKFEVNNVTDEIYEALRAYPMPLRNYRLSLTITK